MVWQAARAAIIRRFEADLHDVEVSVVRRTGAQKSVELRGTEKWKQGILACKTRSEEIRETHAVDPAPSTMRGWAKSRMGESAAPSRLSTRPSPSLELETKVRNTGWRTNRGRGQASFLRILSRNYGLQESTEGTKRDKARLKGGGGQEGTGKGG